MSEQIKLGRNGAARLLTALGTRRLIEKLVRIFILLALRIFTKLKLAKLHERNCDTFMKSVNAV